MGITYSTRCEQYRVSPIISNVSRGDMITPENFDCSRGVGDFSAEGSVLCTINGKRCPVYETVFQKIRSAPPAWARGARSVESQLVSKAG